ncbi:MAG: ribonuclease D [Gammaproteobacteria bacterium]|jgi:ribonuclease D
MVTTNKARFVDTPGALDEFIRSLDQHDVIAIDTEFVRERTYYPQLCLIQVAAGDQIWCLDPITIEDTQALFTALNEPSRLKIFHSGRQDLEIFFNETEQLPRPVFDTQIAAALLGRPDQIAYAGLVQEFYDCKLDKSSSRTNWAQRPLSAQQLEYAGDDVRYLEGVKRRLEEELQAKGREPWLQEECERLTEVQLYVNDPDMMWQRIKGVADLDPAEAARAVKLAAWREITAQSRNLPRGWVIKDDRLIALARANPKSMANLSLVEGLSPSLVRRHGEEILDAGRRSSHDRDMDLGPKKQKLSSGGKTLLRELADTLSVVASKYEVSSTLIASRRELESAIGGAQELRLFDGWRRELFGDLVKQKVAEYSKSRAS